MRTWVVVVVVVYILVSIAFAQKTKIKDRGVCGQESAEIRLLCAQVQTQGSKIAELEAMLYSHMNAHKRQQNIEPRRPTQ